MKKVVVVSLLLVLILSCVLAFGACTDTSKNDPNNIVGYYYCDGTYMNKVFKSSYDTEEYVAYLIVRSDGSATRYIFYKSNMRYSYQKNNAQWSYNEKTKKFTISFVVHYMNGSKDENIEYTLSPFSENGDLLDSKGNPEFRRVTIHDLPKDESFQSTYVPAN